MKIKWRLKYVTYEEFDSKAVASMVFNSIKDDPKNEFAIVSLQKNDITYGEYKNDWRTVERKEFV